VVDRDDDRVVEAGAGGSRHGVTCVVIEEPEPGVGAEAFPAEEAPGPDVRLQRRLAAHPL
jgi:hypothetical protein